MADLLGALASSPVENLSLQPMNRSSRVVRAAVFVALCLLAEACGGKPFNVKTVPRIAPERVGAATQLGSLVLRASAMWDEDWLLDNFDANAILAGVLPVRIDVEN